MFPKQFYTRKRHPTMLEPNPRLDTLKPHVHKAVHAPLEHLRDTMKTSSKQLRDNFSLDKSTRRGEESGRAAHMERKMRSRERRENSRRQHEAFLRLTRSWVKTPCVICNIEGHLAKDCPRNAQRAEPKIRKRIKHVVRPSSA